MPINGPSSYVPTINEFLAHWTDVNTALGAGGPLVLPGPVVIADLTALRDALQTFASSLQGKINDVEIARGNIDLAKAALLNRLGEFNRKVRGFLGHTAYVKGLPLVPATLAGSAVVLEALDDMATLWTKINAATIAGFTGPLTLLGGYAVAAFSTDLAALKTLYLTWQGADQDVKLERERRNDVQDKAYPILRDYRVAVAGSFAPEDALVESLPRLTPEAGSTPDAVVATGVWDAAAQMAKITWSASEAATLDQYQVRMSPGADYSTETETVIGNVGPSEPRELLTEAGLTASGDVASFKVYVLTTTGNEAGSNAVSVTRP